MGAKLVAFCKQAEEKGGVPEQVKLAMITKLSLSKAGEAPDAPETIALFEKAMAQI